MKPYGKKIQHFAADHRVLAVLLAAQLVITLVLLASLFRPTTAFACQAGDMANLQPVELAETTAEDGTRALAVSDTVKGSLFGQGKDPMAWLQSAPYPLPAGRYRCTVHFASDLAPMDTAGTCTFLSADADSVSPAVTLRGDTGTVSADVWMLNSSADTRLTIYAQTPTLKITSVEVQEIWSWRLVKLLQALVLFALADWLLLLLVPGTVLTLPRPRRLALLGLLGVVALVSLPALAGFASYGFDLEFHLSRISGIAAGLAAGQFPVRIYPDSIYGFGYASPVFYGDLLLYFPAVLHLLGYPLYAAYNVYIVLLNALTAGVMYLCLQKMFRSVSLSFTGAALYATAAYRLFNGYYRPALGEFSAQAFLPLIVYGFWALYADSAEEKQRKSAWLPLMLGFSGVIQTHVITTEITALTSVVLCLLLCRKTFQRTRLFTLLKGAAGTVLLNLWFLVPFFSYMRGNYKCTATDVVFDMDKYSLAWPELFCLWGSDMESIRLGVGLLLGVALFLLCCVLGAGNCKKEYRLGIACALGGFAAVFLATSLMRWNAFSKIIGTAAAHYLCAIQFPFRYLSVATVLLVMVSVCGVALVRRLNGRILALCCAGLLVGASCLSAWMDAGQYLRGTYGQVKIAQGSEISNAYEISGLEYLPTAFSADIKNGKVQANWGSVANVTAHQGLRYEVTAENSSSSAATITFPLTYYPGYSITQNSGGELGVEMADTGVVNVILSAGYQGSFTLDFREPRSWRLAELVSLAFAIYLLAGRRLWNKIVSPKRHGRMAKKK